jgi:hypothetical protein
MILGGIDNYILKLDSKAVSQSNYVTKMRLLISSSLFYKGLLHPQMIRNLGYDKTPPPVLAQDERTEDNEDAHLV